MGPIKKSIANQMPLPHEKRWREKLHFLHKLQLQVRTPVKFEPMADGDSFVPVPVPSNTSMTRERLQRMLAVKDHGRQENRPQKKSHGIVGKVAKPKKKKRGLLGDGSGRRRRKAKKPALTVRNEKDVYNVEKILDKRPGAKGGDAEYLVKWEGYSESQNTWEPLSNIFSANLVHDYEAAALATKEPKIKSLHHEVKKRKHGTSAVKSTDNQQMELEVATCVQQSEAAPNKPQSGDVAGHLSVQQFGAVAGIQQSEVAACDFLFAIPKVPAIKRNELQIAQKNLDIEREARRSTSRSLIQKMTEAKVEASTRFRVVANRKLAPESTFSKFQTQTGQRKMSSTHLHHRTRTEGNDLRSSRKPETSALNETLVFDIKTETNLTGKSLKRIIGMADSPCGLLFLVKLKGEEQAILVKSEVMNVRFPFDVIKFYEDRAICTTEDGKKRKLLEYL